MYINRNWKEFQKRRQPKIILADKVNFSFDFGLILAILRRFKPLNDGNQLPGCRLFSRYDINKAKLIDTMHEVD